MVVPTNWHLVHIPKTAGTSMELVLCQEHTHLRASETPRLRFAFVRHPLERLVSHWFYCGLPPMEPAGLKQWLTTYPFAQPMTYWLDAPMDFIGRFERLKHDWKRISNVPLPHLKRNPHPPWREVLDEACERVAREFYRTDFETYGYE